VFIPYKGYGGAPKIGVGIAASTPGLQVFGPTAADTLRVYAAGTTAPGLIFGNVTTGILGQLTSSNTGVLTLATGVGAGVTAATFQPAGGFTPVTFVFANIATALTGNGQMGYCSDCTITNPCAGSGNGAIAKRLNGVNVCN
jgi:hypothetical protein